MWIFVSHVNVTAEIDLAGRGVYSYQKVMRSGCFSYRENLSCNWILGGRTGTAEWIDGPAGKI